MGRPPLPCLTLCIVGGILRTLRPEALLNRKSRLEPLPIDAVEQPEHIVPTR